MKFRLVLCSILVAGIIAWGVKLLNWVWLRPRRLEKAMRRQGLNGNSYRLLVGDMKDLISAAKQEQFKPIQLSDNIPPHIFPYFHQTIAKYGENCFIWFGPSPRLMISDPQLMKEILSRPDVFRKPHPDPIGQTVAGGLLFLEGRKWAKHRKIISPAFHTDKLKNMVAAIGLSCSSMLEKWEAMVGGDGGGSAVEVDVWPFIEDFSGDVISRAAFGSSHEQGRRIFELQKELVKLVLELMQFMFIPGWRYVPTKANRRTKAMSEEIRSLVKGIIEQRERATEKEGVSATVEGDLLDTLMESNRGEAEGMSIEDVIEECKLFYFAGSETTSLVLVWTLVMLSKHQEWQARAREEVLEVFGDKEPSYDGLNRLKIVTMILNEVLRMYPPAPLLARAPTQTVRLGNMSLPVGVDLMLLIGAMHHDPDIWGDDVSEFRPERFENGRRPPAPASFIPFSAGPRVCIGQNLGMMEAKMAAAMMLKRFAFELSPAYRHAPFLIITLQPQLGALLLLRKL